MTDEAVSTSDPQPGDTAEPPAQDDTWLDTEIPQGADVFDRKYVEDIRKRSANLRERAHIAEERSTQLEPWEVFNQFGDRDQEVWKELGEKWWNNQENPVEAAQLMREISNRVLGEPEAFTPAPEETPPAMTDTPAPDATMMTPEQVNEIVQQAIQTQQATNAQADSMRALHNKIGEAGYAEGSLESLSVMWYLNRDPEVGGDLDKAIAAYQARGQAHVDEFVAKKGASNPLPMAPGGTGGADLPDEPRRGHELEDARRGADAWLDSQAASR